jgi:hypothetical protein
MMKGSLLLLTGLFAVGALALAQRAAAQDAYSRGVNDGYNDVVPPGGPPPPTTDYGRGFQDGRDDAYDDDEKMQQQQLKATEPPQPPPSGLAAPFALPSPLYPDEKPPP